MIALALIHAILPLIIISETVTAKVLKPEICSNYKQSAINIQL